MISMKRILNLTFLLMACFVISSCSDDGMETQTPMVRDSQTDMQVLSRFVDINESTNEYYINKQMKTRASSYITNAEQQELQNVSPVNYEKYMATLAELNNNVAKSIADPKVAYIVLSANGKTVVKKVKDNVNFGFELLQNNLSTSSTRALPSILTVEGGRQTTTGQFYDASRTIRMDVRIDPFVEWNYYYFDVLSPDAKPNPDDNNSTPESVAFSGTGPLWNTNFTWTAYRDAQGTDGKFRWEFKGRGNTPSSGIIASCSFSY